MVHAATVAPPPSVETDPDQQKKELEKETNAIALRGDDERLRPDSQIQATIGNTLLTFTGALNVDTTWQDNLNLDKNNQQDRLRFTPGLDVNFILTFPQGFYFFSELGIEDELTFQENVEKVNRVEAQVNELFIQAPLPFTIPSALRVGRQQFFEPRRWYLNEELDGIRFFFDPDPWHFKTSISTPVLDREEDYRYFDDIFRKRRQFDLLFETGYVIGPQKQKSFLSSYVLQRKDTSSNDDNPIWVGIRSYGRPKFKFDLFESGTLREFFKPRLRYWIDAAFVGGTQQGQAIRGFAFDVGATYIARKIAFQPYFTLGFAYGSGDNDSSKGNDRNFRQTGFQNNSGKFGGVVNFDYYGVLFDPELSNMHIYTVGIGFRPIPRTSIDIVYHYYKQNWRSDELRDIDVRGDLNGANKDLGKEIDLIVGVRAIQNMRFRLRTGYFMPGKAFIDDDPAFEARFDIQLSF